MEEQKSITKEACETLIAQMNILLNVSRNQSIMNNTNDLCQLSESMRKIAESIYSLEALSSLGVEYHLDDTDEFREES